MFSISPIALVQEDGGSPEMDDMLRRLSAPEAIACMILTLSDLTEISEFTMDSASMNSGDICSRKHPLMDSTGSPFTISWYSGVPPTIP